MAAAVIGVSGLLLRFRRGDLKRQPPTMLAPALRFCGRRSLEIYIAQLIGLKALGLALGIEAADMPDDEDDA
jgi:hypothetical protein